MRANHCRGARAWLLAGAFAGSLLSACGGMRTAAAPESHPASAAAPATADAPARGSEQAPGRVTGANPDEKAAAADLKDSRTAPAKTVPPDCVPPPPKPRVKPKPKTAAKEAPPQLPTAPAVVAAPPGSEVAAEARTLPVSVMSILGKQVKGPKGEDLGRVVDVLADASGRVRIAVIDFGGFLGVGVRRIAVDWPLLRFTPSDPSSLLLSVGPDKLKSVPEYKGVTHPQILMETPVSSSDGKQ